MDAATATLDHPHDPSTATGIPNKKLLLWAFLASDCMFFGTLISSHLVYRQHPPPGNPVATQVFDIELTSFSTFILLMSEGKWPACALASFGEARSEGEGGWR